MAEARVLTWEEGKSLPDDAVSWIEVKKGTDTYDVWRLMPKCLRFMVLYPEEYGSKWRAWNKKPTAAQSKATPWKERG